GSTTRRAPNSPRRDLPPARSSSRSTSYQAKGGWPPALSRASMARSASACAPRKWLQARRAESFGLSMRCLHRSHIYLHLQINASYIYLQLQRLMKEIAMSVKEISRLALSEALLSKSPPVVFEALDRKYYDNGHIPTARILPPAEVDRIAAAIADKDQAII